jgi:hypothetical protein
MASKDRRVCSISLRIAPAVTGTALQGWQHQKNSERDGSSNRAMYMYVYMYVRLCMVSDAGQQFVAGQQLL